MWFHKCQPAAAVGSLCRPFHPNEPLATARVVVQLLRCSGLGLVLTLACTVSASDPAPTVRADDETGWKGQKRAAIQRVLPIAPTGPTASTIPTPAPTTTHPGSANISKPNQPASFPASAQAQAQLQPARPTTATTTPTSTEPTSTEARPIADQSLPLQCEVPADLVAAPVYGHFASLLVQLDLLANPKTAVLSLSVECQTPGTMTIAGYVPDVQYRDYVLAHARRVSGLTIRDEMRLLALPTPENIRLPAHTLQQAMTESLKLLFPQAAADIQVMATDDGEILLSGKVRSLEAKLLLSQLAKSQLGCQSVANLLEITPAAPGHIWVTEDGKQMLPINRLPLVPPASVITLKLDEAAVVPAAAELPATGPIQQLGYQAPLDMPKIGSHLTRKVAPRTTDGMSTTLPPGLERGIAADDAAPVPATDRQQIEEIKARLARAGILDQSDLEIELVRGIITIQGNPRSDTEVKNMVELLTEMPDVRKVVARFKPTSIQRNVPAKNPDAAKPTPTKSGWSTWFSFGRANTGNPVDNWSFRNTIRKGLQKMCGDRVQNLNVRAVGAALRIEGIVTNVRDRAFVLQQIDNVPSLQNISYEAVLQLKEF